MARSGGQGSGGAAPVDIEKARLLAELGFGGDASQYDGALEAAGLSNPRKRRIHVDKRDRVLEALEARFARVCRRGDCRAGAVDVAEGRTVVLASKPEHCEVCGGSASEAAADDVVRACARRGWTKLVVVGGSPAAHDALWHLLDHRLQVRLVDGSRSRTSSEARTDLQWADLVVLWGGTILDHKVSGLYRGPNVVRASRRSVSALAQTIVQAATLPAS